MKFIKQVNKDHYNFSSYYTPERNASLFFQLNEVISFQPSAVLEVGPGPGIFKAVANKFDIKVETLDIDSDLSPDHICSVFDMPFENNKYDVVCAFQMLEHLPFNDSIAAFKEMARIANKAVIISLPDATKSVRFSLHVPTFGYYRFMLTGPSLFLREHIFDGQHYWEIGKKEYSLRHVLKCFQLASNFNLVKTFRVYENPYHRFIVFARK